MGSIHKLGIGARKDRRQSKPYDLATKANSAHKKACESRLVNAYAAAGSRSFAPATKTAKTSCVFIQLFRIFAQAPSALVEYLVSHSQWDATECSPLRTIFKAAPNARNDNGIICDFIPNDIAPPQNTHDDFSHISARNGDA